MLDWALLDKMHYEFWHCEHYFVWRFSCTIYKISFIREFHSPSDVVKCLFCVWSEQQGKITHAFCADILLRLILLCIGSEMTGCFKHATDGWIMVGTWRWVNGKKKEGRHRLKRFCLSPHLLAPSAMGLSCSPVFFLLSLSLCLSLSLSFACRFCHCQLRFMEKVKWAFANLCCWWWCFWGCCVWLYVKRKKEKKVDPQNVCPFSDMMMLPVRNA